MNVYMINFPDNSVYVGATKSEVDFRVKNHIAKFKTGNFKHRAIYQKMEEFESNFTYKTLKKCSSEGEMYETEVAYISLFKSKHLLNNSTGGKYSSKGKKVSKTTIEKLLISRGQTPVKFSVTCLKTNKVKYTGSNALECKRLTGICDSVVTYQLRRLKKGLNLNPRKYKIKLLTGGDLSQL
jgi:predicted GIY-YIG superfamily endonuclease